MSYITAIETAVPDFCHKQEALSEFYMLATDDEKIKRKIKTISEKAAIEKRYSVLSDYSCKPEAFTFFPKNKQLEPLPGLNQRMAVFKTEALALSLKAVLKIPNFERDKNSITHIITVTCTGLFAPGLETELIKVLGLNANTQRSSINFMGCNAAIIALNSAHAICTSIPNAKVLVVCTELCTLHFQKNYSDDYILSTALFGDGCAAVIVDSNPPTASRAVKIQSFHSQLIHEGSNEMAWQISETGFLMNLTSYVSDLINGQMQALLSSLAIDPKQIALWSIHSGGKRILDDFSKTLNLPDQALCESYDVLRNYGNMSSATVLFVLKQVIEHNQQISANSPIFAAAFGPGLSIETMQLCYV
ncbi:MAG: type III polyketide synthase [Bacteroidia bacterium]